jgi:exonuclease SbcC
MRPLRLRIKGLRSFRTEHEIDFSDLGLVAIVGDTGAGKSSILEAITYALYNATTWDQRNVKQLISDGANTMSVEFEFIADGQIYRITRSTSRGPYPPPGHELESVTDPTFTRLDSEDAIRRQVIRLVGLDWAGFTSAVILPQGRFQALLQASPGDRTAILKGIFRLTQLAEGREQAQTLAAEYRERHDKLQVERSHLLPNPSAAAKDAARRKDSAAKKDRYLRTQRGEVAKWLKIAEKENQGAETLMGFAEKVAKANVRPSQKLSELASVLREIEAEASKLTVEEKGAQSREGHLRTALEKADESGESQSDLARAKVVLERLLEELPKLADDREELAEEERELANEEDQLAESKRSLKELEVEANRKAKAVDAAERAAGKSRDNLQSNKDLIAEFRRQAQEQQRKQEVLDRLGRQLEKEEENLRRAKESEISAKNQLAAASRQIDEFRRKHAAAHAAQGLKTGDSCPICQQQIPVGFKAPRAPAERAAEKAHKDSTAAAQAASDQRATVAETFRQRKNAVVEARAEIAEVKRLVDAALKRLRTRFDKFNPAMSDTDLLRPLARQLADDEERVKESRRVAAEARSVADKAEAVLRPRMKSIEQRKKGAQRSALKLEERAATLERDRGDLPARCRPGVNAKQHRMQTLLEQVGTRLIEVQQLGRDHATTQELLVKIGNARDRLERRRKKEFEGPRGIADKVVQRLHQCVDEVSAMVDIRVPPPPEDEAPFVEQTAWAKGIEKSADAAIVALQAKSRDAHGRAQEARDSIVEILKEAGVSDAAALDELVIAASANMKRAADEESEALSQIPAATDLDRRIGPARDAISTLEALASLLTDGRFIGYVVTRRQRALLGVASEILGSITGGRYGFAEDFRVIDRISGQPRGARTLSGGEKFLASLALALGLVELAARGGGRLEALFLDEGFGSLDADALDDALGELERRAQSGRLVAVISHVRAVAERIENVLSVTYRPEGSEVMRISGTEREAFVEEEVEEGLLA